MVYIEYMYVYVNIVDTLHVYILVERSLHLRHFIVQTDLQYSTDEIANKEHR